MAMCFAILGLKVPGIRIKNPACVKKTFPNFFQKLATSPPHGLGATLLDAKTGRKLEVEELFADYQAFRERHGCQIDPKDIPAPFSQELAELRERCSVALLALRGAYHKQFDEKR